MSFVVSNKDGVPILVRKSVMAQGRDEVQRWIDENVELDEPVVERDEQDDEEEEGEE